MDDEIKRILDDHEKRIKALEGTSVPTLKEKASSTVKDYAGLSGGIRFLIDAGFLNGPKSANEIIAELKREGYHHSPAPVRKMLSVDFTKRNKILNRIQEAGIWKYVLRK